MRDSGLFYHSRIRDEKIHLCYPTPLRPAAIPPEGSREARRGGLTPPEAVLRPWRVRALVRASALPPLPL
jgi:hypothetical protein